MAAVAKLRCVKEGSKLRVKIISPGYSPDANCQFPKAIRVEGREYIVPVTDISLCDSRGKFFYRVKKQNIVVCEGTGVSAGVSAGTTNNIDLSNLKVFGDENMVECAICMNDIDMKPDIVFVILAPCGHYCSCNECAAMLKDCPMCRAKIGQIVTRDQLQ